MTKTTKGNNLSLGENKKVNGGLNFPYLIQCNLVDFFVQLQVLFHTVNSPIRAQCAHTENVCALI